MTGEDRVIRGEAVDLASDGKTQPQPGGTARGGGCRRLEGGLSHEGDGLTVVDDVRDLVGPQVPVDGRHSGADAQRRLMRLDEFGAIRDEKRDAVAGCQTRGPERARLLVDPRVELAEAAPAGG
jgi:hypothetical protein